MEAFKNILEQYGDSIKKQEEEHTKLLERIRLLEEERDRYKHSCESAIVNNRDVLENLVAKVNDFVNKLGDGPSAGTADIRVALDRGQDVRIGNATMSPAMLRVEGVAKSLDISDDSNVTTASMTALRSTTPVLAISDERPGSPDIYIHAGSPHITAINTTVATTEPHVMDAMAKSGKFDEEKAQQLLDASKRQMQMEQDEMEQMKSSSKEEVESINKDLVMPTMEMSPRTERLVMGNAEDVSGGVRTPVLTAEMFTEMEIPEDMLKNVANGINLLSPLPNDSV